MNDEIRSDLAQFRAAGGRAEAAQAERSEIARGLYRRLSGNGWEVTWDDEVGILVLVARGRGLSRGEVEAGLHALDLAIEMKLTEEDIRAIRWSHHG